MLGESTITDYWALIGQDGRGVPRVRRVFTGAFVSAEVGVLSTFRRANMSAAGVQADARVLAHLDGLRQFGVLLPRVGDRLAVTDQYTGESTVYVIREAVRDSGGFGSPGAATMDLACATHRGEMIEEEQA